MALVSIGKLSMRTYLWQGYWNTSLSAYLPFCHRSHSNRTSGADLRILIIQPFDHSTI